MAILIDLNQVIISNVVIQMNSDKNLVLDENLVRHMVLNGLRNIIQKFKHKYGEVIVCCDAKTSWRKNYFPLYKANRKKMRENSPLDWGVIHDTLNKVKDELKEYFPHKVIDVEMAEADDIIAVLSKYYAYGLKQEVLIVSSDKDFLQLQKYPTVSQYSMIMGKFMKAENPEMQLKEHILRGDTGDGIPNFLSSDNVFAIGERQKSINKKKLEVWLKQSKEDICTTDHMLRGYIRNETLIDLDHVPYDVAQCIRETEFYTKVPPKQKLLDYFIRNKLSNLIEVLDQF